MTPTNDVHAPQVGDRRQSSDESRPTWSWSSLKWWPTLAALALTAFIVRDPSTGPELAPILAASGLVYLGAAALKKPGAAWPLFFGTFVIITITRIGLARFDATWILLALAVLFAGYGFLRGQARPIEGLPFQTIAMVAFGITAASALVINADVGAYLVAAGLLGHAAWDVHHHRVNRVVTRSMAEFCAVLDTLLAVALVVTALRS